MADLPLHSVGGLRAWTCAVALLALTGCGGGGGDSKPGTGTQRGAAPAPATRALPAKWYLDADRNLVPDFVEVAAGYDPRADDCARRGSCPLPGDQLDLLDRPHNTMLLLDSSGSMRASAGGGESKLDAARSALEHYVIATPDVVHLGFEVFGHKGSNAAPNKALSCRGVDVLATPGKVRYDNFASLTSHFKPTGFTPLALALRTAGTAFPKAQPEVNRVIVVTDGVETCGGDPVGAARALHQAGLEVTVDVVGFDIQSSAEERALRRIAEASGGSYIDAGTAQALRSYFDTQIGQIKDLNVATICVGNQKTTAILCAAGFRNRTTGVMNQLEAGAGPAATREIQGIITRSQALSQQRAGALSDADSANIAKLKAQYDAVQQRLHQRYGASGTP